MFFEDGRCINGIYEVDRFLGEGAFAEVYRVKHKFLGRQAMKIFKSPGSSSSEIEQLLGEAIILSRIGHPNIIRVFDAGITEANAGQFGYFTMEYVAGGSLDTFWRSYGPNFVPLPVAVDITMQICHGLSVAHSEQPPIIHRDIKPQNILIGYDMGGLRIRIADFGLAKKVNPLTLLASARGTPAFKPPECLSNMDSCAADVYAIGATLYLLLTDRLPFAIDSRMDFSNGKCWSQPVAPPSHFNALVDPFLDAFVCKSLALKPADRYANAVDMLNDLSKWKPCKSKSLDKGKADADEHKSALGLSLQVKEGSANEMVTRAFALARDAGKLIEAADLLEEALNLNPNLREECEYQLKLWRRGIAI